MKEKKTPSSDFLILPLSDKICTKISFEGGEGEGEEERKAGRQAIIEEIMTADFPKLMLDTKSQIQEDQRN